MSLITACFGLVADFVCCSTMLPWLFCARYYPYIREKLFCKYEMWYSAKSL